MPRGQSLSLRFGYVALPSVLHSKLLLQVVATVMSQLSLAMHKTFLASVSVG